MVDRSNDMAKKNAKNNTSRTNKGNETSGPCPSKIASALGPATRPQTSSSNVTVAYTSGSSIPDMGDAQIEHDPDSILYNSDTSKGNFHQENTLVSGLSHLRRNLDFQMLTDGNKNEVLVVSDLTGTYLFKPKSEPEWS